MPKHFKHTGLGQGKDKMFVSSTLLNIQCKQVGGLCCTGEMFAWKRGFYSICGEEVIFPVLLVSCFNLSTKMMCIYFHPNKSPLTGQSA